MDGWSQLVKSMSDAIEDRSHVTHLGYGVAVVLFVWLNWWAARWVLRQFERARVDN